MNGLRGGATYFCKASKEYLSNRHRWGLFFFPQKEKEFKTQNFLPSCSPFQTGSIIPPWTYSNPPPRNPPPGPWLSECLPEPWKNTWDKNICCAPSTFCATFK